MNSINTNTNINSRTNISILKQLKLKYKQQNVEDVEQLLHVLTNILSYPSTSRANLHMQSNILGKLDLKQHNSATQQHIIQQHSKQQRVATHRDSQLVNINIFNFHTSKKSKKEQPKAKNNSTHKTNVMSDRNARQQDILSPYEQATYCACCGQLRQKQKLSLFTHLSKVQDIGIATRAFFMAYQHVFVIMVSFFLIYGLYAILSNVKACNYEEKNIISQYSSQEFRSLVHQWIFAVSLHANLLCSPPQSRCTCQVQCWIGVALIIIYSLILAALRFRTTLISTRMKYSSNSISNFTVMIQNLPIGIDCLQLQKKLKQYQKKLLQEHKYQQIKQIQNQIKIININRAAPYYLSLQTFKGKEIEQAQHKYQSSRQKIIDLIKFRRKSQVFSISKQQRKKLYQQFQKAKIERVQIYKNIALQYVLHKNQNKIITTPAFVTFQSNYTKQFLIKVYRKSKKLLHQQNFLYFTYLKPTSTHQKQTRIHHHKQRARIKQAPEPQEIIWTNLGQSKRSMIRKKVIIALINLLFLGVCFGATYGLQIYDFNYELTHLDNSSLFITILVTFIIVVISYIISYVLIQLTDRQRNITFMHYERSIQQKYVQSCLANYLIAPLIFGFFYEAQFTGITSVSEAVFILSLDNAFFFPLLGLLDPLYLINRLKKWYYNRPLKKLQLNQRELNSNSEYLQFSVGLQFAYAVNSFIFTCFYAPLQPIIIVFSIAGIFSMYWIQKYILFNRCCRPVSGNLMVTKATHKYLIFGPLAFGIGSLIWPYFITHKFIGLVPNIIMICLSAILIFIPYWQLAEKAIQKLGQRFLNIKVQRQQKFYSQNKQKFKYDYDRLNFMTAKEAMNKYLYETHIKNILNLVTTQKKQNNIINSENFRQKNKKRKFSKKFVQQHVHDDLDVQYQSTAKNLMPGELIPQQIDNQNRNQHLHNKFEKKRQVKQILNLNVRYTFGKKNSKLNMGNYCHLRNISQVDTCKSPEPISDTQIYIQNHNQQMTQKSDMKIKKLNKQQHENFKFYSTYKDDEQILLHEVLQHLKKNFMKKKKIQQINYMQHKSMVLDNVKLQEQHKKEYEGKYQGKNFVDASEDKIIGH